MTVPAIAMTGYTHLLHLRRKHDEEAARRRIVAWQRRMNAAVHLRARPQAAVEPQGRPMNLPAE